MNGVTWLGLVEGSGYQDLHSGGKRHGFTRGGIYFNKEDAMPTHCFTFLGTVSDRRQFQSLLDRYIDGGLASQKRCLKYQSLREHPDAGRFKRWEASSSMMPPARLGEDRARAASLSLATVRSMDTAGCGIGWTASTFMWSHVRR